MENFKNKWKWREEMESLKNKWKMKRREETENQRLNEENVNKH